MKKLSKKEMKKVVGGNYPPGGGDDGGCSSDCTGSCDYTCSGSNIVYQGTCKLSSKTGCHCASAC